MTCREADPKAERGGDWRTLALLALLAQLALLSVPPRLTSVPSVVGAEPPVEEVVQ